MTRLLLPLALLLLTHLPCSAHPDAHNALIRGTVRGTTAAMAYVGYYESALHHVFSRTTLDSAPISAGRFSVAMQLNHGVVWYLKIGDAFVTYDKFIAPGDTLLVEYSRSRKSETVVRRWMDRIGRGDRSWRDPG